MRMLAEFTNWVFYCIYERIVMEVGTKWADIAAFIS